MVGIINYLLNIKELLKFTEFKQRLVSTIGLSFLFVFLFLIGNPYFSIFFCFLFCFLFFEFDRLNPKFEKFFFLVKSLTIQSIFFIFVLFEINNFKIFPNIFGNFYFFVVVAIIANLIFLIIKKNSLINYVMSNLIILSFFSLIDILQKPHGLNVFLYIVILVSSMDIFAYIGGKIFGKNKIIPQISKGKTIEGTIIGLIFTIFISLMIKDLINFKTIDSLICGVIIGILAFLGDLIESYFKRNVGVKDSGNLIPGHGGLMDRFDGYLIVLPLFNLFY